MTISTAKTRTRSSRPKASSAPRRSTVSARAAAIAVLKAAGKPLTAAEIADAVISSGVVKGLQGATPKATISAMITSGAKVGKDFRRVGEDKPARFGLQRTVEADEKLVEKFAAKPEPQPE